MDVQQEKNFDPDFYLISLVRSYGMIETSSRRKCLMIWEGNTDGFGRNWRQLAAVSFRKIDMWWPGPYSGVSCSFWLKCAYLWAYYIVCGRPSGMMTDDCHMEWDIPTAPVPKPVKYGPEPASPDNHYAGACPNKWEMLCTSQSLEVVSKSDATPWMWFPKTDSIHIQLPDALKELTKFSRFPQVGPRTEGFSRPETEKFVEFFQYTTCKGKKDSDNYQKFVS